MKIPASHIQVSSFHKWQVVFHVQQGSVFDPGETELGYLTLPWMSFQLESARNCCSVAPTYQSSTQ